MKPTILLINFQDQQKLRKLKMALLPFKLRIKTIEPQDYSQPIGYLAGVKEISQVQIPSAAVLTEHNQNWNCMQLYKELEKEHNMYHPS